MVLKSLLIIATIVCTVYCESKITLSITNQTQVDLQTYLADLEVAAASSQYSANLNARLVNMLQELLKQKKFNCNDDNSNMKAHKEKFLRLPGYRYIGNSSIGFILYSDEPLTWNEARKSCKSEKSELAVPRNFLEFHILWDLLQNFRTFFGNSSEVFLGLHHLFGKDDWLTVSGESIPEWVYHEDHVIAKDQHVPHGNCTGLNEIHQLISIDCNTRLPYFCEIR